MDTINKKSQPRRGFCSILINNQATKSPTRRRDKKYIMQKFCTICLFIYLNFTRLSVIRQTVTGDKFRP